MTAISTSLTGRRIIPASKAVVATDSQLCSDRQADPEPGEFANLSST